MNGVIHVQQKTQMGSQGPVCPKLEKFRTRKMAITTRRLYETAQRYEANYLKFRALRQGIESQSWEKETSPSEMPNGTKTVDLSFETPKNTSNQFDSRRITWTRNSVSLPFQTNGESRSLSLPESDEIPPEGIQLSDVYTLIRKIGEGGNGRIYLARDNNLDIPCAIKILIFNHNNREENKKKFYMEIKTTARLRHPNVVNIFYANHLDNYFYYVMEYIPGKTCEEVIRERALSEKEVYDIAIQLAQALRYAHQHNVIHRDIKPANIMMDESGSVKLLDLGLAISLSLDESRSTTKRQVVGTPYYLAPEQAQGDISKIDERADIYGFGSTLYHLLTREVTFRGKNIYETLCLVLNPTLLPRSPKEINANVSEKMSDLVMKCIAKSPERRFQNMEQVIGALEKMAN